MQFSIDFLTIGDSFFTKNGMLFASFYFPIVIISRTTNIMQIIKITTLCAKFTNFIILAQHSVLIKLIKQYVNVLMEK